MTLYVDLGVKRIQEYLGRTSGAAERQLRKRRGASRMVAGATAADTYAHLGFQPNEETYTAEGVAHLKFDPESNDPSALARTALRHARGLLPEAYLEVSWCVADSYGQARTRLNALTKPGVVAPVSGSLGLIRGLPEVREDAYARRCASCGLAAAYDGTDCADCELRDAFGANSPAKGSESSHVSPEDRVIEAVSHIMGAQLQRPRDLAQLAAIPAAAASKRNHLATIYADGNAIGQLFDSLDTLEAAKSVSIALDKAIKNAGHAALAQTVPWARRRAGHSGPDNQLLPAVVTVLAADDALFTVPAAFGWAVVRELIAAFNVAIHEKLSAVGLSVTPSLTAGIVFHNSHEPMERCINRAAAVMRQAKDVHRGQPAIGWLDLTHPQDHMVSRTASWFDAKAHAIDVTASMPGNQRAKWEMDLRSAKAQRIDDERTLTFLAREARRLGMPDQALSTGLDDLTAVLNIARWWPATTETGVA